MSREVISSEYAEVCRNHPEAVEIFKLERLMRDAGFDFYFNVQDESEDIFDDEYEYMIETQTGELIGECRAPITVFLNRDGEGFNGLELLDMRPARGTDYPTDDDGELHTELSAEQAMEIIEEFFKTAE